MSELLLRRLVSLSGTVEAILAKLLHMPSINCRQLTFTLLGQYRRALAQTAIGRACTLQFHSSYAYRLSAVRSAGFADTAEGGRSVRSNF